MGEFVELLMDFPILLGIVAILVFLGAIFLLRILFIAIVRQGRGFKLGPLVLPDAPERVTLKEKPEAEQTKPTAEPGAVNQTSSRVFAPTVVQVDPDKVEQVEGSDIGRGIKLGGEYYGQPLDIIASGWKRYGQDNSVRSGWLYSSTHNGVSHAIAFFKVHVFDDGRGYIHIQDAANPGHMLWLETAVSARHQELFCWDCPQQLPRSALWEFRWKL